jgi:hypothetical protein
MTDIDLQCAKNSETLLQTQHIYHLLAERYSKNSVLQKNINTLRPKTYEAYSIPVVQPFFTKDNTLQEKIIIILKLRYIQHYFFQPVHTSMHTSTQLMHTGKRVKWYTSASAMDVFSLEYQQTCFFLKHWLLKCKYQIPTCSTMSTIPTNTAFSCDRLEIGPFAEQNLAWPILQRLNSFLHTQFQN